MTEILISIAIGYLLGSIPTGLLLTRAAGLGDIRAIGSGNIGTTNVLRTGNRWLAAATLAGDVGKAALAVALVRYVLFPQPPEAHIVAGVAAFVGHVFPVWLGFRGGKGVATYIGALIGMCIYVALAFCAVWLVIAFARRQSSLAALTAGATAPVFAYVIYGPNVAAAAAAMSLLLFFTHRGNIRRLLDGTEPKIGEGGGTPG